MQDFNISRFIHHTKEYLKASARRAIYSSTDAGMKVAGNLLTILLVLSLLPFVMILLLFAGVAGINAWLELGWGWSFLIGAGVLLLLVIITLLLRKVIVRAIMNIKKIPIMIKTTMVTTLVRLGCLNPFGLFPFGVLGVFGLGVCDIKYCIPYLPITISIVSLKLILKGNCKRKS